MQTRTCVRLTARLSVRAFPLLAIACATEHPTAPLIPSADPSAFRWNLPPDFPTPFISPDNPMSDAKVELGRRLFYDTRLSGNGAFSCSSCHRQENAFADARNLPFGSTGQPHPRNSMALPNVVYQLVLGWADPRTTRLEDQALIPMLGEHPVELGLAGKEAELLDRLRAVPIYQELFRVSYPNESGDHISLGNVTKAIAAFERTFISGNSPYDRWKRGDATAISASAQRGFLIFVGDRLKCSQCHTPPFFTNAERVVGGATQAPDFFNNGLYNVDGNGAYPAPNTGLFAITGVPSDMGKFKVPTLRNIEVTFPYMHDGTVGTLSDVIDHYAAGGRTLTIGQNAGVGSSNPYKDPRITGFTLSASEKADVLAFLKALTDSAFLTNPKLTNPWIQ